MDNLCNRFTADGCLVDYHGVFCTQRERDWYDNQAECRRICQAMTAFMDYQFSRQSDQYVCGSMHLVTADHQMSLKEECGLDCPSIPCAVDNIDTCTEVQNPPTDRVGHCRLDFHSLPICRAPDEDPPVLAAGGLFQENLTRRSLAEVDPAGPSRLTFTVKDQQIPVTLRGTVDILGETCAGCPVSFRMSVHGDPTTVDGHSVGEINLSAGTGTVPVVALDASGNGIVPPGTLNGTLSMNIDGKVGFVTSPSSGSLNVRLNRPGKRFRLFGTVVLQGQDSTFTSAVDVQGPILNQPPTASAGPDKTLECTSPAGASVPHQGAATDPDGFDNLLLVAWYKGAPFDGIGGGDPAIPWLSGNAVAPLGTTTFSFLAEDRRLQGHADSMDVTVVDTTPPRVIDFEYGGPACLWAPNHKYVVLRVDRDFNALITDACDPSPQLLIDSASSSQPDNAQGDGTTLNDVVVFPDRVCLRSERQGTDPNGREYAVKLVARDASGNESDPEVRILVGHDQEGATRCQLIDAVEVVDDGDPACAPPQPQPQVPTDGEAPQRPKEPSGCAAAGGGPGLFGLILALGFLSARRTRWVAR
ncbi:MAG: hypothetical protein ACYC8T_00765 [Myxococcaceae bacterium]